jgi:hypothetical protein
LFLQVATLHISFERRNWISFLLNDTAFIIKSYNEWNL